MKVLEIFENKLRCKFKSIKTSVEIKSQKYYSNLEDDSYCIRIRFEDIENMIDLLNNLYD